MYFFSILFSLILNWLNTKCNHIDEWFLFYALQEASNVVDIKSWPVTLDTDDMPKKKLPVMYRAPTAEMLAYLDFRYRI